MQNKDLGRFYPYNPKLPKPFDFVRYDENGKIPGVGGGSVPIGTLKVDHVPTDVELNAYVLEKTGRQTQVDDTIIVVVTADGKTTTYNYYYTSNCWDNYELTGVDLAANGVAGIVSGTYGIGSYDVLLDIINGEVVQIYVKSESGNEYVSLKSYLESIAQNVSTIEGELTKQSLEVLGINSRKWIASNSYEGFNYVANIYLGEFTSGPYLSSSNSIIDLIGEPEVLSKYGICLKEIYHSGNDYYARFLAIDKPTSAVVLKLVALWNTQYEEYQQPIEPVPAIPEGAIFDGDGNQLLGMSGDDSFELLIVTDLPL